MKKVHISTNITIPTSQTQTEDVYSIDADAIFNRFKKLSVVIQNGVRLDVKINDDSVWLYENNHIFNTIPKQHLPEHWILKNDMLHRINRNSNHFMGGPTSVTYVKAEQG